MYPPAPLRGIEIVKFINSEKIELKLDRPIVQKYKCLNCLISKKTQVMTYLCHLPWENIYTLL